MSVYEILEIILLPLLIATLLALPLFIMLKKGSSAKSLRRALITNLCVFAAVMLCAIVIPAGGLVHAAADTAEAAASASSNGLGFLAAALAVGVGSIGCGIAVGNAAPAAIGALAEDSKSFAKALIFVAMGEGVGIYGTLIAIMILSKIQ